MRNVKKLISSIMTAVMILTAAPLSCFAGLGAYIDLLDLSTRSSAIASSGICGSNVSYSFDEETGLLTISGSGDMNNYNYDSSPFYFDIRIKQIIILDGVTSIGEYSFFNCIGLESVSIPESMIKIGNSAFEGCSHLQSVNIPQGVNYILSGAFAGCKELKSVSIPGSVKKINQRVFYDCAKLETVELENGTDEIKADAFYGCKKLNNIQIPETVTAIGDWAFKECKTLTSISIPDSVVSIGEYTFSECINLTNVSLGKNIRKIGECAFSRCESLDSIVLPEGFTEIESLTFSECYGLRRVVIPNTVITIRDSAFRGCTGIKTLTIPKTVTTVSDHAFWFVPNISYSGDLSTSSWGAKTINGYIENDLVFSDPYMETLTACINSSVDITIPDNVLTISDSAFEYCTNIKSVNIPETITDIGSFFDCKSIQRVHLPTNIKKIPSNAFCCCYNLTEINIPESVTEIEFYAFSQCYNMVNLNIPDSVTKIGTHAFGWVPNVYYSGTSTTSNTNWGAKTLNGYVENNIVYLDQSKEIITSCIPKTTGEIVIEDCVKEIRKGAFQNCVDINSIVFGDGLTCLDDIYDNFSTDGEKNLNKIVLGKNIVEIKNFADCPNLQTIVFNNDLKTIGDGAFNGCISLSNITIPSSVQNINQEAFAGCENLKIIRFEEGDNTVSLSIDSGAFYGCNSLTSVVIPSRVSDLGTYSFGACENLRMVRVEKGVNTISDSCFWSCNKLNTVYLPNSIKSIEKSAFYKYSYNAEYCGITFCFYGTKEEWNNIDKQDESLQNSTIHYLEHIKSDSTCSATGYEYDYCEDCNTRFGYIEYPRLQHTYEAVSFTAPTCSEEGYTTYRCSSCNEEYHDNFVEKLSHAFIKTVIEPTCLKGGYTIFVCSECSYAYRGNEKPATGHKYNSVVVPPTCGKGGYTMHTCEYCMDSYTDSFTDSLEHEYIDLVVPPTCKSQGYTVHTCKFCNDSYVDSYTEKTEHHYTSVVVQPSCLNEGYTLNTCDDCGFYAITDKKDALGHEYFDQVTEPTCENGGYITHTCIRGDSVYVDSHTDPLGHDYEPTEIKTTCIQDGCTLNICKNCGRVSKIDGEKAYGHTFCEWAIDIPASENVEGIEKRVCKKCGYTEERTLPMLEKVTFKATFVADGKIVSSVEYIKGAKSVQEPVVPQKDRCKGLWEKYTLNDSDITINAVYEPVSLNNISGISTSKDITYDDSTGKININLNVSSKGQTVITQTKNKVPLDIVLVIDQSGSMADFLGGYDSKIDALADSANSFVEDVYNEAVENDIDHRIAVVGFGMGNSSSMFYPAYYNTEILSAGRRSINYGNAKTLDYKNALQIVNENGVINSKITNAINNIDADGATAADFGLEMATNIFANNPIENDSKRERLVIFMTDGAPTYTNGFSTDVANSSIMKANQLKNVYNASIYCVGIMRDEEANNARQKEFMNRISSNCVEAINLSGETHKSSENFYISVNDTDKLSSAFTEIITESITRTCDFDDVTVIETLSENCTLTPKQEKQMRIELINDFNVNNSDIIVTRNTDNTTTIIVKHLSPKESENGFSINLSIPATLNDNTNDAGIYAVDTYDSGIIIGAESDYESTFDVKSIMLSINRNTAQFKVNGELYDIFNIPQGVVLNVPETDFYGKYEFSGWNVEENYIMCERTEEFDSTLVTQEFVVIWNMDGKTVTHTYHPGDVITIPNAGLNSNGSSFRRWNGTVPVVMPDHSIEFTAVYGDHEHSYIAHTTKTVTCTEDGTVEYTCSVCNESYTETVKCTGEHCWKAIAGPADKTNNGKAHFICENCGMCANNNLEYLLVNDSGNERGHISSLTHELYYVDADGNCNQPDGDLTIVANVNEYFENAVEMNVYRLDDNGNKIKCESDYKDGVLIFETNHFSAYVYEPVFECQMNDNHCDHNADGYCDICDSLINEFMDFVIKSEIDATIEGGNILFGNDLMKYNSQTISTIFDYGKITVAGNRTDRLSTGDIINLVDDNGVVRNSLTVVIFGDVNGDGWYDGTDAITVSCIANGMLTREQVGEAIWMAADCNHDGIIDQSDVDLLNQAGVLLANVDQTQNEDTLMTNSSYVEYLNLIDQQVDVTSEEATEDNANTPSQKTWYTFIKLILEIIKQLISTIKMF